MRHELIHFLSHAKDEQIIASVIENLNAEEVDTLFHYLEHTNQKTKKRWHDMLQSLFH